MQWKMAPNRYCSVTMPVMMALVPRWSKNKQTDGTAKPIVYISRATLDAERNWTASDLEAASIVWAIKRL